MKHSLTLLTALLLAPLVRGWTPINVRSTSSLGGHIIALAMKGCDGVSFTGNEFTPSTPPKQGAWITAHRTENLLTFGNKLSAEVPEPKTEPNASTHQ